MKQNSSSRFLRRPVARPRTYPKLAAPGESHFERVIPRGRRLRHKAYYVLHVQFRSKLLDCTLKRHLLAKRERCTSGAFRQHICGVRLEEPREFGNSPKRIHLLFCRGSLGGLPFTVPVASLGVLGFSGRLGSLIGTFEVNAVLKAE